MTLHLEDFQIEILLDYIRVDLHDVEKTLRWWTEPAAQGWYGRRREELLELLSTLEEQREANR